MPSSYAAFDCLLDNDDGSRTPIAGEIIAVYDATNNTALSDTSSDADGHVPGASVAPAPGTVLRFSFRRSNGLCGYTEILTAWQRRPGAVEGK